MDDLYSIIPSELTKRARDTGSESLFPYPDVLKVVNIATDSRIAILGVEVFQIQPNGLLVIGFSEYRIPEIYSWDEYVKANNEKALEFIDEYRCGEERGYILTSASERELRELRNQR